MNEVAIIAADYNPFLNDITEHIHIARVEATRLVNKELAKLYWTIGERIVIAQNKYGWGQAIVQRLSKDLNKSFPGVSGFSARNLWVMRQVYMEYVDYPKLQLLAAELPWSQNVEIISRVKDEDARIYYLKSVAEMVWTKDILILQIKSQTFETA